VVRYWRAGEFNPARFRHGWMPPHPTFFLRRELYERFGGYRTDLGTAADYELMLRMLLRHGVPTVYIPKVLVHMRVGGASNRSLAARLAANRMDRAAWRVNDLRPLPWTTLAKPLRKVGQWWRRPPSA
jgi:glycosyltransferase